MSEKISVTTHRLTPEEHFILSLFTQTGSVDISALDSRSAMKVLKSNKLLRRTAFECIEKKRAPGLTEKHLSAIFERLLLLWEKEKRIYLQTLEDLTRAFKAEGIDSCLLKGLSRKLSPAVRNLI